MKVLNAKAALTVVPTVHVMIIVEAKVVVSS